MQNLSLGQGWGMYVSWIIGIVNVWPTIGGYMQVANLEGACAVAVAFSRIYICIRYTLPTIGEYVSVEYIGIEYIPSTIGGYLTVWWCLCFGES